MNPTLLITARYSFYFTVIYSVAITLGNVLNYFLRIDLLDAISISGFMAAIVFSACQFAYEQKRRPKQQERIYITIGCIALSYAVSLAAFIALSYIDRTSSMVRFLNTSWGLMAATYLTTTLIYVFCVYFSYDWVVDMILKHQKKKKD